MRPSINEITIAEDSPETSRQIENELLATLHRDLPQGENKNVVLAARDRQGRLIGGLSASTSYGWLLIKSLWVIEDYRGQSIGRSLLEYAEESAKKIGCHGAWLDTSNPDALPFYEKLGYVVFGELANEAGHHPPGHRRWFMKRQLV